MDIANLSRGDLASTLDLIPGPQRTTIVNPGTTLVVKGGEGRVSIQV